MFLCFFGVYLGVLVRSLNSYKPVFDGESSHEVRFSIGGHTSEYGATQGFGNFPFPFQKPIFFKITITHPVDLGPQREVDEENQHKKVL